MTAAGGGWTSSHRPQCPPPTALAALAALAELAVKREMTRSMPKQACTGVRWKRIGCVGGGR